MSTTEPPAAGAGDHQEPDPGELEARIELLAEENERLRREYARARRSRYRRTAVGLAAVGLVALLGAAAFPDARAVLLALGATGVFGGLLTYYVTPERFVAASVGEAVYRATAETGAALVDDLGLSAERVYVPLPAAVAGDRDVTLFVPQHEDYDLPDATTLEGLFVVTDDPSGRGVALPPTGAALLEEFERARAGTAADEPGPLAEQLADGVVEAFELADGATPEVDADEGRVSVGIDGSAMGAVDRFDHPIASFLACGLAVGLDSPVRLVAVESDDGRFDAVVTCAWTVGE